MPIPEAVNNAGELFSNDRLEHLSDLSRLTEDTQRDQFDQIREHYERRRAQLEEEGSTSGDLGFFYVGRILHILGYTHSHNESLPNETGKVDYALFESPEEFRAHEPNRGTSQLFAGGVAVMKLVPWGASLDGEGEVGEVTQDNPAFELDDIMRQTGLQWAMLTNGQKFRLYHRNTAGMLNTFYEVDLQEILDTHDFDAFKYFAAVFGREALSTDQSGSSLARRLLA